MLQEKIENACRPRKKTSQIFISAKVTDALFEHVFMLFDIPGNHEIAFTKNRES
jgi:hypothetical protein